MASDQNCCSKCSSVFLCCSLIGLFLPLSAPSCPVFPFFFSNFPICKSCRLEVELQWNSLLDTLRKMMKASWLRCTSFLLNNSKRFKTWDLSFSVSWKAGPPTWFWHRYRTTLLCKWRKQTEGPVYCNYACLCRKLKWSLFHSGQLSRVYRKTDNLLKDFLLDFQWHVWLP